MDRLVQKLSETKHSVVFEPRSDTYDEIKRRLLEIKYVFIKFVDTIGETELAICLDDDLTDLRGADFIKGTGCIHVVGTCELNYQKVKCIADINLKTKKGMALLELVSV